MAATALAVQAYRANADADFVGISPADNLAVASLTRRVAALEDALEQALTPRIDRIEYALGGGRLPSNPRITQSPVTASLRTTAKSTAQAQDAGSDLDTEDGRRGHLCPEDPLRC